LIFFRFCLRLRGGRNFCRSPIVLKLAVSPDVSESGAAATALQTLARPLGICGTGLDLADAAKVSSICRQHSALPVMVQPNAGLPVLEKGKAVYKQLPADVAGANIVGACCAARPSIPGVVEKFNQGQ
jgi:methionine synthase I (cobalamin-dependent)